MRITNAKYSAELRWQGLLKGSTSELAEARPRMSLGWKQLVFRRRRPDSHGIVTFGLWPWRRKCQEAPVWGGATGSPASQVQRHTRVRLFQDEHISGKTERKKINEGQEFSDRRLKQGWGEGEGGSSLFALMSLNHALNSERVRAVSRLREKREDSREHGRARMLFWQYRGKKGWIRRQNNSFFFLMTD